MNALVLMAVADNEGRVAEIARTFGVDWPHLVAQIISFGIVCIVLHRFAYKPILKMLEERRRQIEQGLADSARIKAELARTEAQRHEVMVQANARATKLIEEAHAAAARVQEQETQKAVTAAEQIIVKAHEAAEQDYARMFAELKRGVGQLVVQATAMVVGKVLTPEDQRRVTEETVKRMAA
jgi:F-type H+-transporting ATPase subunit b